MVTCVSIDSKILFLEINLTDFAVPFSSKLLLRSEGAISKNNSSSHPYKENRNESVS